MPAPYCPVSIRTQPPAMTARSTPTLPNLLRIASASDALEAWLRANAGSNDDWLVEIKADEKSGRKLCGLLQDLREALKPYRREAATNDKTIQGAAVSIPAALKPLSLSDLILAVGNENIVWQRLDEAITSATRHKGRASVTFSTDQLNLNEIITGDYKKRGLIVWLPVEKLPKL